MFDFIKNSLNEKFSYVCDRLGSMFNQLPEEARKVKLRVYQTPPWLLRRKSQKRGKVHENEQAKGPPHSETKTFNKPRIN